MTDPTPIRDLIPEALELIGSERDTLNEVWNAVEQFEREQPPVLTERGWDIPMPDEWADVLSDDDEPEDEALLYDPEVME